MRKGGRRKGRETDRKGKGKKKGERIGKGREKGQRGEGKWRGLPPLYLTSGYRPASIELVR